MRDCMNRARWSQDQRQKARAARFPGVPTKPMTPAEQDRVNAVWAQRDRDALALAREVLAALEALPHMAGTLTMDAARARVAQLST